MARYPTPIIQLINQLKKLPGVGSKTAERFAFSLLDWNEGNLEQFALAASSLKKNLRNCHECNCLIDKMHCPYCMDNGRDKTKLCLTSSVRDVFIIEETSAYHGLYHVLGALLSPLDGRSEQHLQVDRLKERIDKLSIKEVILAFDSTLEGDATALYLKEHFDLWKIQSTRLAFGLPMGSALDFVDRGTLAHAIDKRF